MAKQTSIDHYAFLNEIDAKSPFIQEDNHSEYELINWQRAAAMNEKYARDLGWMNHIFAINDLLLQATGQHDTSLYGETFAKAIASWQKQQGFPEKNSDGIIGPNTWSKMKPMLNLISLPQAIPVVPISSVVPSIQNIFDFNQWYAQKILDAINTGVVAVNSRLTFKPKEQLEKIVQGQEVIRVNPNTRIIQALPLIYHICEQARLNNYTEIVIGSFIRGPKDNGACKGHCAGRAIDINFRSGSFATSGSVQMVINILTYLNTLPGQYKKDLRFGLPLQGDFFGNKNLAKFTRTSASNLIDPQLRQLIPPLGMVFPDNPDHLHIQVNWELRENEFSYEDVESEPHEHYEESEAFESTDEYDISEQEQFIYEMDGLVKDWSPAIRLNRNYANQLGWGQFQNQINNLLLPFSGQQNVSLGEEAFAEALSTWQQQNGFSAKDADGILGPKTWRIMQPMVSTTITSGLNTPTVSTAPSVSSTAQAEWNNYPNIQARYPSWQIYKIKRDEVVSWGISNPATYIDAAIMEWNANPSIHRHFNNGLDGSDARSSYINLKRLYEAKGITNPANYFSTNIVTINFFNRSTPGHKDLRSILQTVQANLISSGNNFTFKSAWSFVPRTFNSTIHKLSNHALGKAIDINPDDNPHIIVLDEIKVINAVCSSILPNGLLAAADHGILRNASIHFQQTFNDAWLANQSPAIKNAAAGNRTNLNKYASKGFLNLPSALISELKRAGLNWGGSWRSAKDFMHFELP